MSLRRCLALLAVGGAASLVIAPTAARAQATETPAARADRLFREGKTALEAGRYDEACPELAESQRLDPAAGTLLALALCDEGRGHTASAWREFGQVADESQKANRADRVNLARAHQQSLEARLSRLEVDVAQAPNAQATVRVDGEELPASSWGKAVPIDPGDHTVDASMPGASPWKTTVHVGAEHDTQVVSVPALAASAAPPAAPSPLADHPSPEGERASGDRLRTVGWIVGGVGLAAIGTGSVFGAMALGAHHDATKLCPSSPCADATGVDDENRAKTQAWVADVGIGVGIAAVAVGAYLVFLRPHGGAQPSATLTPTVGPHASGLAVRATW